MNAFTARPEGIVASSMVANAIGSLLGSLIFVFVIPSTIAPLVSQPSIETVLGLSFFAFLAGLFWILAYAAPVMALMRRIGFGGPVTAFIVGLLPASVAAALDPKQPIGVLAVYGGCVTVTFCVLAYSGVFAMPLRSSNSNTELN